MSYSNVLADRVTANAWVDLAAKGITNAMVGLSRMAGRDIKATSVSARTVLVKDTPDLLGGPEACIVGVYLGINGDATGHLLIAYHPETAMDLVDVLMETAPGSTQTLGEMEQSVLGEVGNVAGSFFMNTLADSVGLSLRVSPPAVMMDMAGAVLDCILAQIMRQGNHVLIVETTFGTLNREVQGSFLVLPDDNLLKSLLGQR